MSGLTQAHSEAYQTCREWEQDIEAEGCFWQLILCQSHPNHSPQL